MEDFTYNYPLEEGGYHWNMLQRCRHEVGIEPISTFITDDERVLKFDRKLTAEEKTKLDALMADEPGQPPKGTAQLQIDDLWERFEKFKQSSGIDWRLYYAESVRGSGNFDLIELHCDEELNEEQLKQARLAYADLIREV